LDVAIEYFFFFDGGVEDAREWESKEIKSRKETFARVPSSLHQYNKSRENQQHGVVVWFDVRCELVGCRQKLRS
jgi:hypothetical protein